MILFHWPLMLWGLLVLPTVIALYVLILRRRKREAVRYASLSIVRAALGPGQQLRRHLPPILFLIALALMLLASARPVATLTLPTQQETVILAMDVSGSMRATDVKPNRIQAAQAAAKAFIGELPPRTRVGIVAFAATATLVQTPTLSREDLLAAIDRFQLQRGTATGSGLLVSLATLLPDAGIDVSQMIYGQQRRPEGNRAAIAPPTPPKEESKPVPPGSNHSVAVILLSDGQRTTGPDPLEAARLAANHGVRVYTVGIGTKEGETIGFENWSMRVRLDEETLKRVADLTLGEYFFAGNAIDLQKVYQSLTSRIAFEKKQTEISALFAGIAALVATLAAVLSLWWFGRVL